MVLHQESSAPSRPQYIGPSPRKPRRAGRQAGVVLLISLIMLVVISLLTLTSIRGALSTESVTGNVRTTELATQAAEIALRHCEASVVNAMTVAGGGTPTYPTTFAQANIAAPLAPPAWQSMSNWDGASSAPYVLPLSMVNQPGMTATTYKRAPECMVESLLVTPSNSKALNTPRSYVITARGFGPEVSAADAGRSRPAGSEIWLQSQIALQ